MQQVPVEPSLCRAPAAPHSPPCGLAACPEEAGRSGAGEMEE